MWLRSSQAMLAALLVQLKPKLAAQAQIVYDAWQQNDDGEDEEHGSGGICDAISNAWSTVLAQAGIDVMDGGWEGDDHAYLIAYNDNEAYAVDLPANRYETGGGYNWKKIPNVVLQPQDILIYQVSRADLS